MTALNESFFSGAYGLIQLHSLGIAYPRFSTNQMDRVYKKHGKDGRITYADVEWNLVEPEDRTIFLTDIHELDHFATLTSTPAGVLLWRLYQVILRDVSYFAMKCREFGAPIHLHECTNRGILGWHQEFGRFRLRVQSSNVQHGDRMIEYLECELLAGLDSCLQLLDILTCEFPASKYSHVTVGDFASLLNTVYDYLARRCDIASAGDRWNAVWAATTASAPLFDGESSLNFRGVLEFLAYARERRTARQMGASEAQLEQLEGDRLPGSLVSLFSDWIGAANGNETLLRSIMNDALLGRVDLSTMCPTPGWNSHGCGEPVLDEVYRDLIARAEYDSDGREVLWVESEWPWFRSRRLRERYDMTYFPCLRPVLTVGSAAGTGKLYGPGAQWDDVSSELSRELSTVPTEDESIHTLHLRRTNDAFMSGLKYRHRMLLSDIKGLPHNVNPADMTKHLLLVEYSDCVYDHNPSGGSYAVPLLSSAVYGTLTSTAFHIALGHSPPDPCRLGGKLSTGIDRYISNASQDGSNALSQIGSLTDNLQDLFQRDSFVKMLGIDVP